MSTDITTRTDVNTQIVETGMFSTVDAKTMEGKAAVYNALNDATPLRDVVGETLSVKDIIVQRVEVETDEGDVVEQPRTSLITSDGEAYSATSNGIFSAVKNILGIFGHPSTWESPLKVVVEEKATRRNAMYRYLTLSLA
jgi:hypothetical protein